MIATPERWKPSALRLLEALPGIPEVVWATVTRLASERSPTSVLFTAAERRAGTTVLASATAIALAQHKRVPVCLVETNVRRPAMAEYLGLQDVGLNDVLDGHAELENCLQEVRDCPGLLVLCAGSPRTSASGEFSAERLSSILASLEQRCQYLVLDTAPVLEDLESRMLLRRVDGIVLVLRARATRRSDAERTHDILVESGTPVLGSIFNDCRTEGRFGGDGTAERAFEQGVRAERLAAAPEPWVLRKARGTATDNPPTQQQGVVEPTNGAPFRADVEREPGSPASAVTDPEVADQGRIALLERRILKLTRQLEETEADLRRIAAMKDVELGLPSLYRSVQGLSSEEEARSVKQSLMQAIFQSNLELKTAMARHT